jgi:type IV secretory pathway TrbD component
MAHVKFIVMGTTEEQSNLDHAPRAIAILSGVLISAAVFILLLWALAWLMPRFLRFADTPYAKLLPLLAAFFIVAGGALRIRRNRHSGN